MKIVQILVCLPLFSSVAFSQVQNVIGYLPYYRGVSNTQDYSLYTHIIYFSIWPNFDGSLRYYYGEAEMRASFNQLKSKLTDTNTKLLISFGGTSEDGSKDFPSMAINNLARAAFVANTVDLCERWGADGIDIDWEWGGDPREIPIEAKRSKTFLMTELKAALSAKDLILSTATASSSWYGQANEAQGINQADIISIMSYAYNGAWSPTALHHSSLNQTINEGLNYWVGQGINKSKLNIGIPFYGQEYIGTHIPGGSFQSVKPVIYADIKPKVESGDCTLVKNPNEGSYCYFYSENKIIFFDTPINIEAKVNYSADNGYGGVMVWEIGQDDEQQTLGNATNPIID